MRRRILTVWIAAATTLSSASSFTTLCHRPSTSSFLTRRSIATSFSSTKMSASASMEQGLKQIGAGAEGERRNDNMKGSKSDEGDKGNKPQWMIDLNRSLARNGKDAHSRYIQLATVSKDEAGKVRPACRTVVFRGFHPGTEMLKMITDSRSEKFGHLTQNDAAEICFYFVKTREQYRLSGHIKVISSENIDKPMLSARKHQWSCLSDSARIQFIWPHPGQPQPEGGYPDPEAIFSPPAPTSSSQPPDTFCLLLFTPDKVDHLELKANPQRRTLHVPLKEEKGDEEVMEGMMKGWDVIPVNP